MHNLCRLSRGGLNSTSVSSLEVYFKRNSLKPHLNFCVLAMTHTQSAMVHLAADIFGLQLASKIIGHHRQ